MKKRILMLLTVVALMVVMLVSGVASTAFARTSVFGCTAKQIGVRAIFVTPGTDGDRNGDGIVCGYANPQGTEHIRDNHPH